MTSAPWSRARACRCPQTRQRKRCTDMAARKPAKKRAKKKLVTEIDNGSDSGGGLSLVIVESPAKAKTIGKYLGRGYKVKATVGHIMDLPEKKLGIDVENGFKPDLVPIPGKEKTIAELKSAAKNAKAIFIATDPDREGEAIAQHVADQIRPKRGRGRKKVEDDGSEVSNAPIKRVLFHEITKDAVQSAIKAAG